MIERFRQMPSALRANSRSMGLGGGRIPALVVHPDWQSGIPAPCVIWLHGRTANKELDPGRYLRWMRAGIGACALDLPGHGERAESPRQSADDAWDVMTQVVDEIDQVVADLAALDAFDPDRMAIGGMSLGGMAALARLCHPHRFVCASVEATSGSWLAQRDRGMFTNVLVERIRELNPIEQLQGWRGIPLQAIHSKLDQWVSFESQSQFIHALQARHQEASLVDFVVYERTGAPHEHIGFGEKASEAKDRQRDFLAKWLKP